MRCRPWCPGRFAQRAMTRCIFEIGACRVRQTPPSSTWQSKRGGSSFQPIRISAPCSQCVRRKPVRRVVSAWRGEEPGAASCDVARKSRRADRAAPRWRARDNGAYPDSHSPASPEVTPRPGVEVWPRDSGVSLARACSRPSRIAVLRAASCPRRPRNRDQARASLDAIEGEPHSARTARTAASLSDCGTASSACGARPGDRSVAGLLCRSCDGRSAHQHKVDLQRAVDGAA